MSNTEKINPETSYFNPLTNVTTSFKSSFKLTLKFYQRLNKQNKQAKTKQYMCLNFIFKYLKVLQLFVDSGGVGEG